MLNIRNVQKQRPCMCVHLEQRARYFICISSCLTSQFAFNTSVSQYFMSWLCTALPQSAQSPSHRLGSFSFVHVSNMSPVINTTQVHSKLHCSVFCWYVLLSLATEWLRRNPHTELLFPVQTAGSCHSYHRGVSACRPGYQKPLVAPWLTNAFVCGTWIAVWKMSGKTLTVSMNKITTVWICRQRFAMLLIDDTL